MMCLKPDWRWTGHPYQLESEGSSHADIRLPEHLVTHQRPHVSDAVRRRHFSMNMGMGMMSGMMGEMFGINGRTYDMNRIDEEVRLGGMEIWEVSSEMMAHPFHVHGVHFEVLSRNGGKPDPRDQGLKDTVMVNESVELLVQFIQPQPQLRSCITATSLNMKTTG